tara:strand:- start:275 stop:493 length:219 start_codon:yes stop_codon:yes gene_type:complete
MKLNIDQGNKMTQSKFNTIMKSVLSIKEDGPMDDEAAFNTAEFILMDNPGLKEYIQKVIGARDAVGWLAGEI